MNNNKRPGNTPKPFIINKPQSHISNSNKTVNTIVGTYSIPNPPKITQLITINQISQQRQVLPFQKITTWKVRVFRQLEYL